MKNILISLVLLTSTTGSYAFREVTSCSVYTYGHGSKDELFNFLQNLKQLTKQYECNNMPVQDGETEALCTECNFNEPTPFFNQITSRFTEQQDEILQPCRDIDFQPLKESISKMILFPLTVISTKGIVKAIRSAEEFYDLLPSILNNHVLQTIQNQNFEDMLCRNVGAFIGQHTIWIKRDDSQQLRISMIKTSH